MKKRITLNLVCTALGVLTLTDACLAATNAVDTAMVAASFMSYAEHPTLFDSREIDAKVATLLKQMTLKEKLGQLTQFSNGDATGPDSVKIDQNELAALGGIGSMLNLSGAKRATSFRGRRWKNRAENPHSLRSGRDPRSPHGLKHSQRRNTRSSQSNRRYETCRGGTDHGQ